MKSENPSIHSCMFNEELGFTRESIVEISTGPSSVCEVMSVV
jgi:hypothetical protein